MKLLIVILANALTLGAAVPYLVEIARGKTKPRIASWFGWGALTVVGAAAAFSQHQLPAAVFLSCVALENFSIVVLGLAHGDRRLSKLDLFCLAGSCLAGSTLLVFKSPVLGTWVAIITDFIVLIPTLQHTWQQPGEETAAAYILEGIACVLTLTVAGGFAFTAVAYPLYLLVADETLTVLILKANRRQQLTVLGTTSATRATPTPAHKIPLPGTLVHPAGAPDQPRQ